MLQYNNTTNNLKKHLTWKKIFIQPKYFLVQFTNFKGAASPSPYHHQVSIYLFVCVELCFFCFKEKSNSIALHHHHHHHRPTYICSLALVSFLALFTHAADSTLRPSYWAFSSFSMRAHIKWQICSISSPQVKRGEKWTRWSDDDDRLHYQSIYIFYLML